VYAALAATLLAGLDGVDAALTPPAPCDQDLYSVAAAGGTLPGQLPRSLQEALDALVADTALVSALGPAFVEQFLLVKRAEWDAFHLHVSTWEMERYAAFY